MEEAIYKRAVKKSGLAMTVVDDTEVQRVVGQNESTTQRLYSYNDASDSEIEVMIRPPPPSDKILAFLFTKFWPQTIRTYHEHDAFLREITDKGLTEAEREEAWAQYENPKAADEAVDQQPDSIGQVEQGSQASDENDIQKLLGDPDTRKVFQEALDNNPELTAKVQEIYTKWHEGEGGEGSEGALQDMRELIENVRKRQRAPRQDDVIEIDCSDDDDFVHSTPYFQRGV